jgi:hypothetical protein
MPPRRSPRTNQAIAAAAIAAAAIAAAEAVPEPVRRPRGRPRKAPAPVLPAAPLANELVMPAAPQLQPRSPLDNRIYTAHPLAHIPTELYSLQQAEQENKIYVSRRTYEALTAEDTPTLAVIIHNQTDGSEALASIEGTHFGEPNDVYVPHHILERINNPEHINLLLVRTQMPAITKLEVRIMDNDFALEDPLQAIQDYLNNYYVLEEGTTLNIYNEEMCIYIPVYIEKVHPEPRGSITSSEIELELLRIEVEEPAPLPPPQPIEEVAAPIEESPVPMIPDYYPDVYKPKDPPKIPTQEEKDKIRLARLARFG